MIIDFYINFLIMYKRGLGMPLPCDNHQDIIYSRLLRLHLNDLAQVGETFEDVLRLY